MKNAGYVNFGYNKDGVPNIISNPLPNHSGPKVNAISMSFKKERKAYVRNIITPLRVIYEKLAQVRFFQPGRGEAIQDQDLRRYYCQYHAEVRGHSIQECGEFQEIIQDLIDRKEIEFFDLEDSSVNVIMGTMYSEAPSSIGPRPIIIFHNNEAAKMEVPKVPTLVLLVEVPKPFPYAS